MGQFSTAKRVFSFLVFFGWVVAAIGVLIFILTFKQMGHWVLAAASGGSIFISGIFTVVAAQMGLAQITTAENTAAILAALTRNNQQSAPVLTGNSQQIAPVLTRNKKADSDLIKTYKGYEIIRSSSGVTVSGVEFAGVLGAEKWIDSKTY